MIDDLTILVAARWLADHEWEGDAPRPVARAIYRQGNWVKRLGAARTNAEGIHGPGKDRIGASAPRGPREDGRLPMATVHIVENTIFGYIDDEAEPSFLWPGNPE